MFIKKFSLAKVRLMTPLQSYRSQIIFIVIVTLLVNALALFLSSIHG